MPRLFYELEDYLDFEAAKRRSRLTRYSMLAASILCALAGDAMNPSKGLRGIFTATR